MNSCLLLAMMLMTTQEKLPPEAQKIVDKAEVALEAAKKTYDEACAKIKAQEAKDLQQIQDQLSKKGNTDGAASVKKKIEELGVDPAELAKPGDMTEEQWKKLPYPDYPCKANEVTNLKVTLANGQKVKVVPNPADTWQSGPGSNKADFKGEDFKQGTWNRMSLLVRVGEDPAKTQRVADDPTITGPGKVYISAHDTGSINRIGTIRVKLVPVK